MPDMIRCLEAAFAGFVLLEALHNNTNVVGRCLQPQLPMLTALFIFYLLFSPTFRHKLSADCDSFELLCSVPLAVGCNWLACMQRLQHTAGGAVRYGS